MRREVNDYPPDETTISSEEERNRSIARGPMLNMVLKYMPYLKQYERDILGSTVASNSMHTFNTLSSSCKSICTSFGPMCFEPFGSECPLYSSMCSYFESMCTLFGSLCSFSPLVVSYLL